MRPLPHALALSFLLLAAEPGEEELKRAKELLAHNNEKECTDGANLCVSENSVGAVELLLDVLRQEADRNLPVAHYRDVAWEALRRISAADARARVSLELEKNKKEPFVRQWCAETLGEYGGAEFVPVLTKALGDRELGVRRAAARALARVKVEDGAGLAETHAALAKLVRDKDSTLRANALEALARLDAPGGREGVIAGLKDADAGVRCGLLSVVGELWPAEAETHAHAALKDPDWRPRLEAVDILGETRTAGALRALIDALADERPVVNARAVKHLQERTGRRDTKREAWETWWDAEGAGFDPARRVGAPKREGDQTAAGATSFNGIVFDSDHTAFLIDVSEDMKDVLEARGIPKIDAAVAELGDTLTRLQGEMSFSLFAYANDVVPFSKSGPVELSAKTREKALDFVRAQPVRGRKDIWEVLQRALEDTDIDTVFLLSCGEPDVGLYVHWNRVTWHLADANRFRNVVVHAVAYSDKQWYRDQLQKIAESTGGEFKYFE